MAPFFFQEAGKVQPSNKAEVTASMACALPNREWKFLPPLDSSKVPAQEVNDAALADGVKTATRVDTARKELQRSFQDRGNLLVESLLKKLLPNPITGQNTMNLAAAQSDCTKTLLELSAIVFMSPLNETQVEILKENKLEIQTFPLTNTAWQALKRARDNRLLELNRVSDSNPTAENGLTPTVIDRARADYFDLNSTWNKFSVLDTAYKNLTENLKLYPADLRHDPQ